jgi:hypothetical protein
MMCIGQLDRKRYQSPVGDLSRYAIHVAQRGATQEGLLETLVSIRTGDRLKENQPSY